MCLIRKQSAIMLMVEVGLRDDSLTHLVREGWSRKSRAEWNVAPFIYSGFCLWLFTSTEMSLPEISVPPSAARSPDPKAVPGVAFLFPEICKMHITDVKLTTLQFCDLPVKITLWHTVDRFISYHTHNEHRCLFRLNEVLG
jgi:hypothetical protein